MTFLVVIGLCAAVIVVFFVIQNSREPGSISGIDEGDEARLADPPKNTAEPRQAAARALPSEAVLRAKADDGPHVEVRTLDATAVEKSATPALGELLNSAMQFDPPAFEMQLSAYARLGLGDAHEHLARILSALWEYWTEQHVGLFRSGAAALEQTLIRLGTQGSVEAATLYSEFQPRISNARSASYGVGRTRRLTSAIQDCLDLKSQIPILWPPELLQKSRPEAPIERTDALIDKLRRERVERGDVLEWLSLAADYRSSALKCSLGVMATGGPDFYSDIFAVFACHFAQEAEKATGLMKSADGSMRQILKQGREVTRSLASQLAQHVPREYVSYSQVVTSLRRADIPVPLPDVQTSFGQQLVVQLDGEVTLVETGHAGLAAKVGSSAVSEREVQQGLETALAGLVGLTSIRDSIAFDVAEFLKLKQSRGRIFWGPPGVGKTEVAQRLAGLRDGLPGLSVGAGQVKYVSGVDGKLEVKALVDELPPMSVVLLDEADKCLDPGAGMVSPMEAKQVAASIITHFQRKPLLWVLLGTFSSARGEGPMTDDVLQRMLGDELAHRFDYVDWQFPAWTLQTLLQAVNGPSSRRKLQYEDEAALLLAEYCMKNRGGVRAFDNLESALLRQFHGQASRVDVAMARKLLAQRGAA